MYDANSIVMQDLLKGMNKILTSGSVNGFMENFNRFNVDYTLAIDCFRQSADAQLLLSPRVRDAPFYFPVCYLKRTDLSDPLRIQAMICQTLIDLCTASLDEKMPCDMEPLKALNILTGAERTPYDLSSIYQVSQRGLRTGLLLNNLQVVHGFQQLLASWQTALYLELEHHFVFNPETHKELDLISDIHEFLEIVFYLRERAFFFYYTELCCAPINLQFSQKVLHFLNSLCLRKLDITRAACLAETSALVRDAARRITRFFDDPLILRISDKPPAFDVMSMARRMNVRISLRRDLQILDQGYIVQRMIAGEMRPIEYQPPLHFDQDYSLRINGLGDAVQGLLQRLIQIRMETIQESDYEPLQQSGEPDPEELYKRRLDTKFFVESHEQVELSTCLYPMFLIDNSCSIHAQKREKMADLLMTFFLAIKECPELFSHATAMAQHSTGSGRITLRLLVDKLAEELQESDLTTLLHLTSMGVNYDIFAAYELVSHCAGKNGFAATIPLLIMAGDAWPVGHRKNVKEEQKEVMALLKSQYPRMIICYLATDALFPPADLSYDYWISLAHDEPMQGVMVKIGDMIENIIRSRVNDYAD